MDDSKERKQFSNSLFEESLTILIHFHTVGILMRLLLACDLLFFGMQLRSFMHCDSFSNSGGTTPTRFTLGLCLSSSVDWFFFWLNVARSCYQLLNISHSSKVAGATVDWIAYSQMNGSNHQIPLYIDGANLYQSSWNLFHGITHWNNITPKVTLRVQKKKKKK